MGNSENTNEAQGKIKFTKQIQENIRQIKNEFAKDETLVLRKLENPDVGESYIVYIDGMVNNRLINQDVIRPFLEFHPESHETVTLDVIQDQVMLSNSVERTSDHDKLIQAIVYGDTLLLIDGIEDALILNTKGWTSRSISEPENEKVLRGPREGFTESIITNLSLIRRRILTSDLKMEFETFGTRTNTKACICYLDSIVNKDVLAELKKRIHMFSIDGALDSNYINEFIKDSPYSPFKTIGTSEKPDAIAAKLLEGRVALLIDGSPSAITVPYLFTENFQSDEDYYLNYYFTSINRLLRYMAFIMAISIPAVYIALTTFHHEMLPLALTMSISKARQGVPFPTAIEMTIMLVVFEMLRESGARMPGSMGQALSIVGALVMGQAAVSAKIVSAPMIIIVAVAGICGVMSPRIKGATILLRFIFLVMASFFGLYGFMFAVLALMIHLYSISSFGVPIMNSSYTNTLQDKKDIMVRAPWWFMKKRPKYLSENAVRQKSTRSTK
ncbi:spore germination protein [Caproiciproducens galactitolivorans]|uniref:Spore germination protein B1 n=1 Tax=Caproiciproducens galactitolivorans TaxID=642589 RepID=A0A4Z0Y8V2_9FIRM|nr:spore germination protein [Caproiciproducens galactitolivorans]QEY34767.1 spore germination protein [Caproiciproducens galactitolivorans]TGJ75985.1 spore germination protein B1 [Caproiciproducens galactitolivorans]